MASLIIWLLPSGGVKGAATKPIVCTGISIGGWITNLHFAHFGNCDPYKPGLHDSALGWKNDSTTGCHAGVSRQLEILYDWFKYWLYRREGY